MTLIYFSALAMVFSGCSPVQNPGDTGSSGIQAQVQMSIAQGAQSNTLTPFIFVGGTSVVNYEYKIVSSAADCASGAGYSQPQPAWTDVEVDVSVVPDGPVSLCAVGVDSSNNVEAFSSAAIYSWIKIPNPTLTVNSPTVVQGNDVTFVISQSTVSDFDTSVTVITQDYTNDSSLTAQSGIDFTANAGSVIIPAGSLNTTFTVHTVSEPSSTTSKTFQLNLFNPQNATIGNANGKATLTPPAST